MPTGYTYEVQSGKIASLRDYALTCARGMGALIMMRDDPFDAPIPERFEPNTKYDDERIASAEATLAELRSLSTEECAARALAEHQAAVERDEERKLKHVAEAQRYTDMIAKVEAWECKADGLRDFMLSQLRESFAFDCRGEPWLEAKGEPLSGEAWRTARLNAAAQSLGSAKESREKEINRTEDRNRWLTALRESLAAVEVEAAGAAA